MKRLKLVIVALLFIIASSFESCGPVIISSRPSAPPPPWFYPNRVVNVRYVYFPDVSIYYDLTLRHYIYFENGAWISVNVLPQRFNGINFRNSRQIQIRDYFGDDIGKYHPNNSYARGRRGNKN
jgi:hypothetical protein